MARTQIDYGRVYFDDVTNSYRLREGKSRSLYDKKLGSYQVRQYKKSLGISGSRTTSIGKNKEYFTKDTRFTQRTGHLQNWAKPMSLRGGADPNYNWQRSKYVSHTGIKRVGDKHRWGADVNRYKKGTAGKGATLNGTQWIRHFQIALYQVHIQAENFRVMTGKRALKVFQNSFREKKFYSHKGRTWPALSSFTIRKRMKRGTGTRILYEYGALYNSLNLIERAKYNTTRIETSHVYSYLGKRSRYTICHAGWHNEGKGYYGKTGTRYKKRQFMGHSSHLNPITDAWLRKMMKQYLFDSVFQVKK